MIDLVTEAMRSVLTTRLPDPTWKVVTNSLSSADQAPAADAIALTLIEINAIDAMRNAPDEWTPQGYRRAPLVLQLTYMVTYGGSYDESLTRLSRVAQVFHTVQGIEPADLPPALGARIGTIAIRFRNTTIDERQQIFSMTGRPARVALFYQVDAAPIETLRVEGYGDVVEHRIDYLLPEATA
jgi:hypothetical protein